MYNYFVENNLGNFPSPSLNYSFDTNFQPPSLKSNENSKQFNQINNSSTSKKMGQSLDSPLSYFTDDIILSNEENDSDNIDRNFFKIIQSIQINRARLKNNKKKKKKHDKFSKDNIKRKIQVHYIKFLRDLLNLIIKEILKENIEFKPLDYKFKMKIDKSSFMSLKKQSLGNIFKEHISPRCKNDQKFYNIQIYNKIINKSKILKNILDKKYLEFINIYYKNKKKINLIKYGLDKDIVLPNNIKTYENLIKKNEADLSRDDKLYNNKILKILEKEFISPIFKSKVCK